MFLIPPIQKSSFGMTGDQVITLCQAVFKRHVYHYCDDRFRPRYDAEKPPAVAV